MPARDFELPIDLVKSIARGSVAPTDVRRAWEPPKEDLSGSRARNAIKTIVSEAISLRRKRHFGQTWGAVLLGYSWFGEALLQKAAEARLLVRTTPDPDFDRTLSQLKERLRESADPEFNPLIERIDTFEVLNQLWDKLSRSYPAATTLLQQRPFPYLKSLFALANLAFLRDHFRFVIDDDCQAALQSFRSAEDVAAAVSTLIALINEQAPLESLDLLLPYTGVTAGPEIVELLRFGHAVSTHSDVEKLISVLGYRLAQQRAGRLFVFHLKSPLPDVEYFLRLGFVRRDIGDSSSRLAVAREGTSTVSVFEFIERTIDKIGDTLAEIRDKGNARERLVLNIKQSPNWLGFVSSIGFYEDAISEEALAQELEIPIGNRKLSELRLSDDLDFESFYKAWRVMRFISLLDVQLLKRNASNTKLVSNSLVRVTSYDNHLEMLRTAGLSDSQAQAFLRLMFLDVNSLKHVDIQYRPYLTVNASRVRIDDEIRTTPREVIHASSIVAVANIIPNVQRSHGIRINQDGNAFVAVAKASIGRLLPNVRENAQVKGAEGNTDIDLIALAAGKLYMFECKHSLTPTEAHEMRDLWMDIQKGVLQLQLATRILSTRLSEYLPGWFPGTRSITAKTIQLVPCVLCSHRVFSGLELRDIPIRDHASLSLVLGDGILSSGTNNEDGKVELIRYRLRSSENATFADLDDYLAPNSRYFRTFSSVMTAFTRVDRLSDSVSLARETYAGKFDLASWTTQLEELGAQRMEDETLDVGPTPFPAGFEVGPETETDQ